MMESEEDGRITKVLASELVGKAVRRIEIRNSGRELFIEFDDRSRLFATANSKLDLSLT
jgi:hypothetical protein